MADSKDAFSGSKPIVRLLCYLIGFAVGNFICYGFLIPAWIELFRWDDGRLHLPEGLEGLLFHLINFAGAQWVSWVIASFLTKQTTGAE
jgi:hypothetical protein